MRLYCVVGLVWEIESFIVRCSCMVIDLSRIAFSQMNILANGLLPVLDVLVFFSSAILLIRRWVLQQRYSSNHE